MLCWCSLIKFVLTTSTRVICVSESASSLLNGQTRWNSQHKSRIDSLTEGRRRYAPFQLVATGPSSGWPMTSQTKQFNMDDWTLHEICIILITSLSSAVGRLPGQCTRVWCMCRTPSKSTSSHIIWVKSVLVRLWEIWFSVILVLTWTLKSGFSQTNTIVTTLTITGHDDVST